MGSQYSSISRRLKRTAQSCLLGAVGYFALDIQPVQALSFNFSYEESVNQQVRDAIEEAGSVWSNYLLDDVTVNIDIGFGGISGNYLGGARPEMVRVSYQDVIDQMGLDRTSSDDASAFLNLPTYEEDGTAYVRRIINQTSDSYGLWHEDTSIDSLWITRANAKALGIIGNDELEEVADAQIRFNDWVSWDFTQDSINRNQYDFMGVALHEIGHALGFLSGVDVLDHYASQWIYNADEDYDYVTTMDLFRRSSGFFSNPNAIDWSVDSFGDYFSIDGGTTSIAQFSNGASNIVSFLGLDDSFQISHWDRSEGGVMRPVLRQGQQNSITGIDLRLLDAIGWDLREGSQVDYDNSEIAYTVGEGAFDSALGWGSNSSGSTVWSFWQEGTFLASTAAEAQDVPEGRTVMGLAVLSLLSYGLKKRR